MMAQTYGQQIKSTQRERSGTGFRMMVYSFRKGVCILLLLRAWIKAIRFICCSEYWVYLVAMQGLRKFIQISRVNNCKREGFIGWGMKLHFVFQGGFSLI